MKRLWILAAAAAVLLTACGGEEPAETTAPPEETVAPISLPFSLPYYEDASLHPITGSSRTNLTLAPLVYEGLFEVDDRFEAAAVLARSWQRDESGRVWTIQLKEAFFSDGSAVTGEDAAASLELAQNSRRYGARLSNIRSVTGEGKEVTITLYRPHGDLPVLLDVPVIREREEGLPLGTGRYLYAEEGGALTLKAAGDLPEGLPEEIALTALRGADDLIYAFDTKDVSLVVTDLTGTNTLGFSGGYEVWDHPTTTMLYLGFRTNGGICRDPVMRQAISAALDRETVVNVLYARHARSAVLPVSPVSAYYEAVAVEMPENANEYAAGLLKEAGYSLEGGTLYQGRRAVSLTLLVSTDNAFRLSTAEYLAGELGKLGLEVTVEKLPWQEYTERLVRGDFDLYLAETMMTADFDPEPLIGSAGVLNHTGWKDSRTDALLEAFRAAEGSERMTAAAALYQYLQTQAPIAPICFKEQTVLTQWGQITGLTPTRGDPFAGTEWRIAEP